MACLPSSGFDLQALAQLLDLTRVQLDTVLSTPALAGVVVVREPTVRFAHDRMQLAALRLIGERDRPNTHYKIGTFLKDFSLAGDYIYDSVDNMLLARDLGHPLDASHVDQLALLGSYDIRAIDSGLRLVT